MSMELDELNGKCGQIARLFNLAIVDFHGLDVK